MDDAIRQGDRVPTELSKFIMAFRYEAVGIAVNLTFLDEAYKLDKAEALWTQIKEQDLAIRGNRAGQSLATWRDLRVMVANTMRHLADFLDTIDLPPAPPLDHDD